MKGWTEKELRFIHKNYRRMSDEELSHHIDHSPSEIRKIRYAVGWKNSGRGDIIIRGLWEIGPMFTWELRQFLEDEGFKVTKNYVAAPDPVKLALIPRVGMTHRFIYYLEGQEEDAVERILAERPERFKKREYWRKKLLEHLKTSQRRTSKSRQGEGG